MEKQIAKARPKTNTVVMYMGECYIALNSNQIWKVLIDHDVVTAKWKCITLKMSLSRYRMTFKEIKD